MSKQKQASEPVSQDEALFEALGKTKKKRKRRIIITILVILLILALVLVIGVSYLRRQVRERFAMTENEVLSYSATVGTISTTVTGSGTLTAEDLEEMSVPAGVEVTEVLVRPGDSVAAGDVLATVELSTVMSAMSELQAEIDDLDEQISEAEADAVSESVYAGVSGRVKQIYAGEGSDVSACMYEHGALALLSLDGYMAVDIQTDVLAAGDGVTVVRTDGSEISGTVEAVSAGSATILVGDNGPENEETVTVYSADGTQLGSGSLYIHNALRVTGYAGTVKTVRVAENTKVSDSTKLFTLTNTSNSANYDVLLRQRSEKEETLLALLTIYRDGAVLAPFDGTISSVEYSADSGDSTTQTDLVTVYPDLTMSVSISVDEDDILSLEVGQEADITVSSVGEDTYTGIVTEIDKSSASSGAYTAVVTLDKAEGMLAGMTADVEVKIEGVENAVLIPIEALHQTSTGAYVYTTYDEETQEYGGMVDVVTGLSNSKYVEIRSGLSEGDTVYYTEEATMDFFGAMGGMDTMGNMGGMDAGGMGNMPEMGDSGNVPDKGGMGGGRGEGGGEMPGGAGPQG